MTVDESPVKGLENRKPFFTDPGHPVGRRTWNLAHRGSEDIWFGTALVAFISSIIAPEVWPSVMPDELVFVGVGVLVVCVILGGNAERKQCFRCEYVQPERTNYCPSCGQSFDPLEPEEVDADALVAELTDVADDLDDVEVNG